MKLHIPNWYTVRTEGITQSLLSNYMACPKRFLIAVNGYTEKARTNMQTGILGHRLCQVAREGRNWERALRDFKFDSWLSANDKEIMRAVMRAIIPAYLEYWKAQGNPWHIIKPEHTFDVRLGQYRLRGKIDGVWTDKLKQLGILEIKFKSRISEDEFMERLPMDFQSLFYLLALHLERQVYPKKVVYDIIRYPQRKAGTTKPKELYESLKKDIEKNPEYYFYRYETEFTPKDIEAFRLELVQKLDELDGRSNWYKNQFACYSPYRCPYMRFCITGRPEGLIQKQLFSELEDDDA